MRYRLRTLCKFTFWSILILSLTGWYGLSKIEASLGLPQHLRLIQGQDEVFPWKWPIKIIGRSETQILEIMPGRELTIRPLETGESVLDLNLFGVIPLHDRVVSVVPELAVVPGGESIGVMIADEGLIVAELARVKTLEGMMVCPAGEAGVKPGDLLVQINEVPIRSPFDVERTLRASGEELVVLKVIRGGETHYYNIRPAKVRDEAGQIQLRLGVYLEDTAAGVGTLSFYDPGTKRYAALGHMITDSRTGEEAKISNGRIVPAMIAGVRRGLRGQPGEKIGLFQDRTPSLGVISKNCSIGIFGSLSTMPNRTQNTLPIGMVHEVEEGPAYIRTVIENDQIDEFAVKIVKVNFQSEPGVKGMIIEVTDPRLLEITGGIVQGMSGSPIIQKDKIVGVVTHVFVNEPTRGYGVFAEWMAYEAEMFPRTPVHVEPAA